ncbi:glycosyltransferase 87 family protein [Amycolatopsis antarctica]|uniref:glycosyltransferase 87 family protein n=1 Tax=Amycolatopsis antarctica TaxID=1854586 RepID=UPI003B82C853
MTARGGSGPATERTVRPARALLVDLTFYGVCALYALSQAFASEFYGFRVWGAFALVGYGLAAVHTGWLLAQSRTRPPRPGARWIPLAVVAGLCMVVPLVVLVIRRLTGVDWLITPGSWAAQPEVWVIERSAALLLSQGTPYVDVFSLGRPPEVNDYTPYGPVMTVFGLPRALFGGTPVGDALTDARLFFALGAALCVFATLRLLGSPRLPVRGVQLALAFPLTTLTFAVAGPDLAILGPMVLAVALAARDRPVAAAVVIGLVGNAKLLALLAAPVLAFLVAARLGRKGLGAHLLTLLGTSILLNVPVWLVDPAAFTEHVIRFPAGLGAVSSPAASPLPGHLIASTGTAGTAIAFALLACAAVAIAFWLFRRPPVTGSDTLLRTAIGLGAFALLTPATRFGYLVYPVVLIGAMLCFRRGGESPARATSS